MELAQGLSEASGGASIFPGVLFRSGNAKDASITWSPIGRKMPTRSGPGPLYTDCIQSSTAFSLFILRYVPGRWLRFSTEKWRSCDPAIWTWAYHDVLKWLNSLELDFLKVKWYPVLVIHFVIDLSWKNSIASGVLIEMWFLEMSLTQPFLLWNSLALPAFHHCYWLCSFPSAVRSLFCPHREASVVF